MKRLLLIMAIAFASCTAAFAQNQKADSVVNETKTTAQHIESIDSLLQKIAKQVSNQKNVPSTHAALIDIKGTKEDAVADTLISIVAIVFVFVMPIGIVLVIFAYKHKNRKAKYELVTKALEVGKDIPEGLFKEVDNNLMAKGIKNICLGIGLGVFLWTVTDEFGLGCIGLMLMLIGIGQVIIYKTQPNRKDEKDHKKKVDSDSYTTIE